MKRLTVVALVLAVAGCNTLRQVRTELGEGGYALWYPAEEGVEPGQIWITNGKTKFIRQLRPDALRVYGPHTAQFQRLRRTVDAKASLKLEFAEETLGNMGELGALLKRSTVKEVDLDFGRTHVSRLVLGDLTDPDIRDNLPQGYREDLEKVKTLDEYVIVAAVVTSSGLKYTFTCEDTTQLEANAPAISELIGADFQLDITSGKKATWEIPETDTLAIGITFASGDLVRLRDPTVRARMEDVKSALLKLKTVDLEQLMRRHP